MTSLKIKVGLSRLVVFLDWNKSILKPVKMTLSKFYLRLNLNSIIVALMNKS